MGAESIRRWRFSVEDYHRMAEAGILKPDDRVELIEGEIVAMNPIGNPHAAGVRRLLRLFSRRLGERMQLDAQNPIDLGKHESEPQPDLVLLRPSEDDYAQAPPGPPDILLLVEVAMSWLEFDRRIKVPLYARSGILELWIVDLEGQRLEVYRNPGPDGYRKVQILARGERVALLAFPDAELSVDEVLG